MLHYYYDETVVMMIFLSFYVNLKNFKFILKNLSNLGDEKGETFEFWTAVSVWESLSGSMPWLCCCVQKLVFYIPLRLMRAVLGPIVVILTN